MVELGLRGKRWLKGDLAVLLVATGLFLALLCSPAAASQFFFSTGSADGKMAMGSRPGSSSVTEIEAADDFVLGEQTGLTSATFTGLIPVGAALTAIQRVDVEVYRVFPQDSDVTRASGPTFSTTLVPTRVNSPSDVALAQRDTADGGVSFTASLLQASFAASNSVLLGIHPKPNQTTGGDGAVTGEEVAFNMTFKPGISLPAGHYFFVPQVTLSSGDFFWLSAPKPIVPPGTPFPAGSTDLQAWIRNANLDPDWLRVGTDIVGGTTPPTFNGTLSLVGTSCTPISLSPTSLPAATAGSPYAAAFGASGGVAPYSFGESGALPGGMALAANGNLAGTPAQAGTFPLTVTATDADGCQGTANVTLTVLPRAVLPVPNPLGQPAPSISAAHLSAKTFRAASRGASLTRRRRPPVGTTVSYRDSQAATTTFAVLKPVTGHKKGRRCAAGAPRKHQKRCTRYVSLGSFTHADKAGNLHLRFTGRVRRHKLKPARYRLTLTPRANGKTGRSVTLAFRIVS